MRLISQHSGNSVFLWDMFRISLACDVIKQSHAVLVFISLSFPAVAAVFQFAVASDQGEQTFKYQSDVHTEVKQ